MKKNPSALTVVYEPIIIGSSNFYRPVFAMFVSIDRLVDDDFVCLWTEKFRLR